jgi:hypothetical protein
MALENRSVDSSAKKNPLDIYFVFHVLGRIVQ